MTLAIVIAFIFGILASGILTENRGMKIASKGVFRSILGFLEQYMTRLGVNLCGDVRTYSSLQLSSL